MRASRLYGSMRGALSNGRPYRDSIFFSESSIFNLDGSWKTKFRKRGKFPGKAFSLGRG